MRLKGILDSFLEECVKRNGKVRYYSAFSETGFFEGYNPSDHMFDKTKVIRTGGHEATWFHIDWRVEPQSKFKRYFEYWLKNHLFHYGETIRGAATNAIGIVDWDPTFQPWWPKGRIDNPGYPVIFSGIVDFKGLGSNSIAPTYSKKPVHVDRLYRVCWDGEREKFKYPERIFLEDISNRL